MGSVLVALFLIWAAGVIFYQGRAGYLRRGLGGMICRGILAAAWSACAAVLVVMAAWPPFGYLSAAAAALLLMGTIWLVGRSAEEGLTLVLIRREAAATAGEEGENVGFGSGRRLRR